MPHPEQDQRSTGNPAEAPLWKDHRRLGPVSSAESPEAIGSREIPRDPRYRAHRSLREEAALLRSPLASVHSKDTPAQIAKTPLERAARRVQHPGRTAYYKLAARRYPVKVLSNHESVLTFSSNAQSMRHLR